MSATPEQPKNGEHPQSHSLPLQTVGGGETPPITVPKEPLTEPERKALYEKLRARMSKSKLEVRAPAGWMPYWARKDDPTELARLDFLGFRVVREVEGAPARYKAQGYRTEGTYVMGDVILMEIPEDEGAFFKQENSERSRRMTESAKQKFRDDAEKQGAPTFVVKRR